MPGAAKLDAHGLDGREGHLDIDTHHFGTVGIAPLVVQVSACGVVEEQFVYKGVTDAGIETFHQQVGLEAAEMEAQVGRAGEGVRTLHAQVGSVGDFVQFAIYGTHMEVFVVDLRGTEARSISGAECEVVGRGVAQVETWADDRGVNHCVLV